MVNFSIVLIARNEEKTLPRLLASLSEFKDRGGEVVLLDTGSSDNTAKIAREGGCVVEEVGERFLYTIDKETARAVNKTFVVKGEAPVLKEGDRYFHFAEARNYAASLASNDLVSMPDCDEIFTKLDIDYVEDVIRQGFEQLEFNFVFAHDAQGREAIKFVQCKFYDRRKMKWVGIIHEVLAGEANRTFLPEDKFKIEHWQNPETKRGGYLKGLAIDCFQNREYDRNSHYFARELMWNGRPKSAIKEFERHLTLSKWLAERSQSMIFMGDCYGTINDPQRQVAMYSRAFYEDSSRREALLRLANFYKHNNNPLAAGAYAAASLEIPHHAFYANNMADYRDNPHAILYWAKGWNGDIPGAQYHILKALEYAPSNPDYLRDTQYYFEYADQGIDGFMRFEELQWLYNTAKTKETILELGSWKGRSTHALLSGTPGVVFSVDTFKGSEDEHDWTHDLAKKEDIFETFKKNTEKLAHKLVINRMTGDEAAKQYEDVSFDMIFIDAEHTYDAVKNDIEKWMHKTAFLCGHDYCDEWPDVKRAVHDTIGIPDGVVGTIWYKSFGETWPEVSIVIPTLGRPEGLERCLKSIKALDYPESAIEVIVEEGEGTVPEKVMRGAIKARGKYIVYAANDMEFEPSALKLAVEDARIHKADLIAFDTGVRNKEGYINEHFMIRAEAVNKLGYEIFDTDFHHVGVDDLLWKKFARIGKAVISRGRIIHHHFSRIGSGIERDEIIEKGWKNEKEDRELLARKVAELDIPKRIFTIWLSEDGSMPELVKKCVASQKIDGYEHHLITLENCYKNEYIKNAISAKKWVKAVDYLRAWYVHEYGGIYLDADVEVLKPFDGLLSNGLFASHENNGFISNAVFGAVAGHPALAEYLNAVHNRFTGDDDKIFESGMGLFTDILYPHNGKGVTIYPPEYFIPYDHQQNTTNITDNTRTYHHFMKSWVPNTAKDVV